MDDVTIAGGRRMAPPMIGSIPFRPFRDSGGVETFLDERAGEYRFYGSAKAALRDGLAVLTHPGERVLVPSYLPDAVVEPMRELGLEPGFYAIDRNLSPDLGDLDRRIDDRTAAVMSVAYFGASQPEIEALVSLLEERGCAHVADAAHSPLSVVDGEPLGTLGDVGIASLPKLFPVPDGGLLFLSADVADRFVPSTLTGVRGGYCVDDVRFLLKSPIRDPLGGSGPLARLGGSGPLARLGGSGPLARLGANSPLARLGGSPLSDMGTDGSNGPRERYLAARTSMSRLTLDTLRGIDPEDVVRARRRNYAVWRRALAGRPDLEFLLGELPEGICPQACPVVADDPDAFLTELSGVDGVHRWPRLPTAVRSEPTYGTARWLAEHVIVLPVHQHLDVRELSATARRLGRSVEGLAERPRGPTSSAPNRADHRSPATDREPPRIELGSDGQSSGHQRS